MWARMVWAPWRNGRWWDGIRPASSPPAPPTDALLMETGDYILMETGDHILLETG